jgi:hypothetical protein
MEIEARSFQTRNKPVRLLLVPSEDKETTGGRLHPFEGPFERGRERRLKTAWRGFLGEREREDSRLHGEGPFP